MSPAAWRLAAVALSLALWAAALFGAPAAFGATVQDDLEAAHVHWQTGSAAPEPADAEGACRGRWNVVPDPTLPERGAGGAATGLGFTYNPEGGAYTDERGYRWDWFVARCEFTVDPALQGGRRRCIVAHEVGHFVHGPAHVGPMAVEMVHQCYAVADAVEAAEAARLAEAAQLAEAAEAARLAAAWQSEDQRRARARSEERRRARVRRARAKRARVARARAARARAARSRR